MTQHVLITGGAGFIGSHLCDSFLEKGYAVTAVDNLLTGRKANLTQASQSPLFQFSEWDICKPLPIERLTLIQKFGLQGVLHFACPASPTDFERLPFEILSVDSLGTMNSVDLAFQFQARYVLASTSEVYGDPLVHPQNEEYWGNVNTLGPRACYDESKRFAEAYVYTAMQGRGQYKGAPYHPLNAGIVRIFNTYGPRMRPDDGRVVPELCIQALKGQELTIHGDGSQTRSFCFVSDLVDGIIKIYESQAHIPINLGNPVEQTINQFAQNIVQITSSSSQIKYLPSRQDDPKQRCPDISRAKNIIGWNPKIELKVGLEKTIHYFRQFVS